MTERALTCRTANKVAALVCRQPGIHFDDAIARVIADSESTHLDIEVVRSVAWDRIAEHWSVVV